MGYADGFYYGQGRIICDTSTFSVGDTIRVRSVYNALQTEDKQVVTVGTPLIFTVPPYDYYKICKVEEINNVETEIGGEYVTVDYGQTIRSLVVDMASLVGVQSLLNAHQEGLMNIGDEVKIDISGANWIMQVARIDTNNHAIDFVSKDIYSTTKFSSGRQNSYDSSYLRASAQAFYNAIGVNDKQYIKQVSRSAITNSNTYFTYTDYVWIPDRTETNGTAPTGTPPVSRTGQFPIFTTQASRIKIYQGSAWAYGWWLSDCSYGDTYYADGISADGSYHQDCAKYDGASATKGVVPCFRLTADS